MANKLLVNTDTISDLLRQDNFVDDYEINIKKMKSSRNNYTKSVFDIASVYDKTINEIEKNYNGIKMFNDTVNSYVNEYKKLEESRSNYTSANNSLKNPNIYSIKAGDNLWSIAKNYVSNPNDSVAISALVTSIISYNSLTNNGSNLSIGQLISIPDSDVKPTDKSVVIDNEEMPKNRNIVNKNQNTNNVNNSNILLDKYKEPIKYGASATNKNYNVTTGNQTYNLSDNDQQLLTAIVAQEAGGSSPSEALAVVTTILNRYETNYLNKNAKDIINIVTNGEYSAYTDGNYKKYMPGGIWYSSDKYNVAQAAVSDALNGVRNLPSDFVFFVGDGTYNYFRNVY